MTIVGALMPVGVMHVRSVGMLMSQPRVSMRMGMRLSRRIASPMLMLVMRVVYVAM